MQTDIEAVVKVGTSRRRDRESDSRNALLDDEQKTAACLLAKAAGADFVKTSTGFGPAGATVQDVGLMRQTVGPRMGVKASGGIRTLEDLNQMVARRGHSHRRQRQRQDRRGRSGDGFGIMATYRKIRSRFRERAELLDFLLEVSARHLRNAGSRSHAGQRRRDRQGRDPLRSVRHPALQRAPATACASATRIGHREEVVRNLVIPLGEGITGAAADSRAGAGRATSATTRAISIALDAVQTELAVPMIARGKLVGVIDCNPRGSTPIANRIARCCD